SDLMNDPFIGMTGAERMATIVYTLGEYLRLLVFPHPLTHDYYPYHVPVMNFTRPGTLISLALYVALAVIFVRQWRSRTIFVWSIGFFLATLSIVSNFVFPVGTFMNERFLFLPSVAFSLVTAWVLVRHGWHSGKPALRYGALALALVMAGGYIVKNYARIPAWKDALSLNSQAVLVSKGSARANCFMATALYEQAREQTDQAEKRALLAEAEVFADRALAIYPEYLSANQMKSGFVAERYLVHRDLDQLLREFEAIVRVRPQVEYIRQFM